MLPREQLAAGCLFSALGRVRELDLFDFVVFGEETFNGRRLHAWAMSAPAPRAVAGDAKGRRKGAQGKGQSEGARRDGGERGIESKDPIREGPTACPALGTLGNPVRAVNCPGATRPTTRRSVGAGLVGSPEPQPPAKAWAVLLV